LVTRKWTQPCCGGGRPPLAEDLVTVILRLARQNPGWGYKRIQGELNKLGIRVSATSIRTVLLGNGLGPAPRRASLSWRAFLRAQASAMVASDFFTVETVRLTTLDVLFSIELGTRRVRLVGVTDHPSGSWMVQRARELSMERERAPAEGTTVPRFLIRDRDGKFTRAFDDVFISDGTRIIKTPIQAPNANAVAERWVRTVRAECLDWMLIWGRRHLERVLGEYLRHDNDQGPHRGLALRPPSSVGTGSAPPSVVGVAAGVRRRDRLGAWCTSTTRQRHDGQVSELYGPAPESVRYHFRHERSSRRGGLWGAKPRIRVVTRDSVPSADAVPTLVGRPPAYPRARPPRR
jgi:hypothetical protein